MLAARGPQCEEAAEAPAVQDDALRVDLGSSQGEVHDGRDDALPLGDHGDVVVVKSEFV